MRSNTARASDAKKSRPPRPKMYSCTGTEEVASAEAEDVFLHRHALLEVVEHALYLRGERGGAAYARAAVEHRDALFAAREAFELLRRERTEEAHAQHPRLNASSSTTSLTTPAAEDIMTMT